MNSTLSLLNARRVWLVPSVSVWGTMQTETIAAAAVEAGLTDSRIVFLEFTVGGQPQRLDFATLTDHRGNRLPAAIDAPVVILVPKGPVAVAVIGAADPAGFRLAKTTITPEDGLVDLWIIEAGS